MPRCIPLLCPVQLGVVLLVIIGFVVVETFVTCSIFVGSSRIVATIAFQSFFIYAQISEIDTLSATKYQSFDERPPVTISALQEVRFKVGGSTVAIPITFDYRKASAKLKTVIEFSSGKFKAVFVSVITAIKVGEFP